MKQYVCTACLNIARIANAVQCHSSLSGHKDFFNSGAQLSKLSYVIIVKIVKNCQRSSTFFKNFQTFSELLNIGLVMFPHHTLGRSLYVNSKSSL